MDDDKLSLPPSPSLASQQKAHLSSSAHRKPRCRASQRSWSGSKAFPRRWRAPKGGSVLVEPWLLKKKMAFLLSSLSLKLAAFSLTLSLPLCSRDTTREMACSVHWFEIEMRQVRGRKARARKESTVFFLVERVLEKKIIFSPLLDEREQRRTEKENKRESERTPFLPSRALSSVF